MRITVIPSDRLVIVNGVPRECVFESPAGIHAVQFDGESGVAEMKRGEPQPVTLADMSPYITAWEAAAPAPQSDPDPVPPTPRTRFSSLEFLERFTEEEQLAVVTATLASPTVKLWYDKLLAAEFVDLNDPRTEGGLDALIGAGLLDPSRKAGLLTPT